MNGGIKVLLGVFEFLFGVLLIIYLRQHLTTSLEGTLAGFSTLNLLIGIGFIIGGIVE